VSLIFLSRALLCLGQIARARLLGDEALAEAQRLSPYTLAFALAHIWIVDWALQGVISAPTMSLSANEAVAISIEHGFPLWLGESNVLRGWCLGAVGQTSGGISLVRQGIDICRATGSNIIFPHSARRRLRDSEAAGRRPSSTCRGSQVSPKDTRTLGRGGNASVAGTLLLSMREHAAAEDSFHQAIAVARRQNAKFWELRAATGLARLWRDQGKRAEAQDLLAPVYGWFTEGFDTPVLQDGKVLLDQLV
jgi:hypothetical protein